MKAAYAQLPIGIVTTDRRLRVRSFDRRFLELFPAFAGLAPEGIAVETLLDPADRKSLFRLHRTVALFVGGVGELGFVTLAACRRMYPARIRFTGSGDAWFFYCESASDPGGFYLRARETAERWRSLLEATDDGIAVLDGGNRLAEFNGRFLELMGFRSAHGVPLSEEALAERDFFSLPHEESFRPVLNHLAGAYAIHRFETLVSLGERLVRVQSFPLIFPVLGRIGYVVVLHDETLGRCVAGLREEVCKKESEAEETRRQLSRAQRLDTLGHLVAGIAHEVNNPLGYIIANLGVLSDYVKIVKEALSGSGDPLVTDKLPAVRDDLESLAAETLEGAHRIRDIVTQLKTFSRGEDAGEREAGDINAVVNEAVKMLGADLRRKAKVVTEFADLPSVPCRPGQITQVVLNLLCNAADAGGDEGTIRVATRVEGENVAVEVSDDGSGIPPEVVAKLFTPFFTTKPVGQGTGLGLSVSYGIMKEHGGRIEVESPSGGGARFTVLLPATVQTLGKDREVAGPIPRLPG